MVRSANTKRTNLLITLAISGAVGGAIAPIQAEDWHISSPVVISGGQDNKRAVIDGDIYATEANQAALRVTGLLDGILINAGQSVQTQDGFWDGTALTADTAAMDLTGTSKLTGTLENRGYIKSGINIAGQIAVTGAAALKVEGQDAADKAVVLQSVALREGSHVSSDDDHGIAIAQHGFIDFIHVERGATLSSQGSDKSALYVGQQAMLGGGLLQQNASGDTLFYQAHDGVPVVNIEGSVNAFGGTGIQVAGTVQGAMMINGGTVSGSGYAGASAIGVSGRYYGSIQNYAGSLTGGIVVAGSHTGASEGNPALEAITDSSPDSLQNLADGDRALYVAAGLANKRATLEGGYRVLAGGVTRASQNHGLYLNEYASVDFVAIEGRLETTGAGKSAIYVADNAILGSSDRAESITVGAGATLGSTRGSAIRVEGSAGAIGNHGGTLSAADESTLAVDFRRADTPLDFLQQGNALTRGSIAGSPLATDRMTVLGGQVISQSITGIEHMVVSTRARVHVRGDYQAPGKTTLQVEAGYDPATPVITVDQALSAQAGGSAFVVVPTSAAAFNELVDKEEVTVLAYDAGQSGDPSAGFAFSAASESDYIPTSQLLFDVRPQWLTSGLLRLRIKARGLEDILQGVQGTDRQKTLLLNAIRAALSQGAGIDTDKQEVMLAALTEDRVQTLLNGIEQINPSDRQKLLAVQQAVMQRLQLVTGLGFGDGDFGYDYGDDYSDERSYSDMDYGYGEASGFQPGFSFLGGAGWGQFLYGKSRYSGDNGGNGFRSSMTGFVIGMDMDLTDTLRIGGAGSWTRSRFLGNNSASATNNHFMATVYGHWYGDGWYADALFSAGRGSSQTGKVILNRDVTARYQSNTLAMRLIAGHKLGLASWDISPQVELNYGRMTFDPYKEQGDSGFEQEVKINAYDVIEFGLGFRLETPVEKGFRIRPELAVMGYFDVLEQGTEIETSYLAGGDAFILAGTPRDRFRLQTRLALNIDLLDNWVINAGYSLNWSRNFQSHNVSAKARYEF